MAINKGGTGGQAPILPAEVTTQGNNFNSNDQLVKLDGQGNLPAINGANLLGVAKTGDLDTKADLIGGLIPAAQLPPGFNDEISEYATLGDFPAVGEAAKIYIAADTGKTYRWSGTIYAPIGGADTALGETATTAYRGDRGKIAYDHSQSTSGNPHNVTKTDVGLANVKNIDTTNASNIDAGTLADDRLSSNVAFKNANNTFTAENTFENVSDANTNDYTAVVLDANNKLKRQPQTPTISYTVLDNTIATPPTSPNVDEAYIIPATGSTGVWGGKGNQIATWDGAGWSYVIPTTGLIVMVASGTNAGLNYKYSGTAWELYQIPATGGNSVQNIISSTTLNSITLSNWQRTVFANVTSNILTIILPKVLASNAGQNIEIKKIDASIKYIRIIASSGDTIEGGNDGVFLNNQNESVILRSDGVSKVFVVSDNRSLLNPTSGTTLFATLTIPKTINALESAKFDSSDGDIPYNATTGRAKLEAGTQYNLSGTLCFFGSTGGMGYVWYNVATGQVIGSLGRAYPPGSTLTASSTPAVATITPTTAIEVELRSVESGTQNITSGSSIQIFAVKKSATVVNTVDYANAVMTGDVTLTAGGQSIRAWNINRGNLQVNTADGYFQLAVGKPYTIAGAFCSYTSSGELQLALYNSLGAKVSSDLSIAAVGSQPPTQPTFSTIYTPQTEAEAKVRVQVYLIGGSVTIAGARSYLTIVQAGTTGVPKNQDGTIGSLTYSTSEVNTGKISSWGQAIFRKSYSGVLTTGVIDSSLNASGTYKFLGVTGMILYSTGAWVPASYYTDGTRSSNITITSSGVTFSAANVGINNSAFYIEYTKS